MKMVCMSIIQLILIFTIAITLQLQLQTKKHGILYNSQSHPFAELDA